MQKSSLILPFSQIAFIFDLDGTLFDSQDQIFLAANRTRTAMGFPELTSLRVKKLIGLPAEELFQDLGLDDFEVEELVCTFRHNLSEDIKDGNSNLFPGAQELVQELKSRGAFVGVATSKPQQLAELVIVHSDLNGLFDFIQGTGSHRPKPNPDTIVACLERADLSCGVMIGDRTEDVVAGKKARAMTIGIAQTIHTSAMFLESGADFVFDSIQGMHHALDEISFEKTG